MNTAAFPQLELDNVLQSLDTAFIIFAADDPDFTIIAENEAHARMAMVKREDVLGKPLLEAFPDVSKTYQETGKSEVIESLRRVITSGKTDSMPVVSYDLKDTNDVLQTMFWEVVHQPVMQDGKVVAICQRSDNITERVTAKQALDSAKIKLEQALSYSSVGTWQWDLTTNMITLDRNFARIFNLKTDEDTMTIPVEQVMDLIHPDDQAGVDASIQQALNDAAAYEHEFRILRPGAGVKWLLVRGKVERTDAGQPIRFPGAVVDVTEQKQAERKLQLIAQASEQFSASLNYRETLDAITSIIVPDIADWCSIDLIEDGAIELISLAHVDPKKVEWAKQLRENQGPVDPDAPSGSAWVIRTGKTEHYPVITDEMLVAAAKTKKELKLLRDIGFKSVITVPMRIDNKTIGAMTLVSTEEERYYDDDDVDVAQALANRAALAVYNANLFQNAKTEITERKKLQRQLESLNRSLEKRVEKRTAQLQQYSDSLARSNQELQDFAYVASHDLQEPLRKIRAFGDILMAEYKTGLGDGAHYLERMQNAAARMSILIEDLLAFSRVSTRNPSRDTISLTHVVREVLGDLEHQIERTNGTVEVDDLPQMKADPTHMRQVFQNLIGNALKFTRPDVAPIVKIWHEAPAKGHRMHRIYVSDNGIGFDEKYTDRIFSVFQRLHGKDAYEGTGIGLAVVRKIVERYGGTITVQSTPNKGSTFCIELPAIKEK